jgi:hypothetical protein
VSELHDGPNGRAGANVPVNGDRAAASAVGANLLDLNRYTPMLVQPSAAADTRVGAGPRPLSVYEVNERIYQVTGWTDGLQPDLRRQALLGAPTDAGTVFADAPTYEAADRGEANIVSDARKLRAEPNVYVLQCSGSATGPDFNANAGDSNVGLLVLNDPYYADGTDIKLTFPADVQFRESLATILQARVFAPPEGYLARGDAQGNLVIAPSDQFGYGGPPYPSGNAANWVVTEPPPIPW